MGRRRTLTDSTLAALGRWLAPVLDVGLDSLRLAPLPHRGATECFVVTSRATAQPVAFLKVFSDARWLSEEPQIVANEAAALRLLATTRVRAPGLIAVDAAGSQAGVPCIVMDHVRGEAVSAPDDVEAWLRGLAESLPAISSVAVRGVALQPYRPYNDVSRLAPPRWSACPDRWQSAFDLLAGPLPGGDSTFVHRDFHPLNVLWSGAQVAAVVDWTSASIGSPHVDVAHCRLNLALWYGPDVADRFSQFLLDAAGVEADPTWDLRVGCDWLPAYEDGEVAVRYGATVVSVEQARQRLDHFVCSALDRLGTS